MNAEPLEDFGPCCVCGAAIRGTGAIAMIEKIAPVPGTGWGCVVCGLPTNGAFVILCSVCEEKPAITFRFAVKGFLGDKQRVPFDELTGTHEHDIAKHAEDYL